MGTKAIFKIYENGNFVFGSWVKYGGGVQDHQFLSCVLKSITGYEVDKKHYYDQINKFITDMNYGFLQSGDKKKPFSTQINDDGMKECEVLFWDTPLSDKKLMEQHVWGEFIYEVRVGKNDVKLKVSYNGHTKVVKLKIWDWNKNAERWILRANEEKTTQQEIIKWVDDIDFGLNDCNCKDEEK